MSFRRLIRYGTLIIVALVSGLMSAVIVLGASTPKAQGTTGENDVQIFDNIEGAEAAAGYKVFVPTFVPDGFQRGSIQVVTHMGTMNNKSVVQIWFHSQEESFLITQQTPSLRGLAEDGHSTTVRGRPAELVIYPTSRYRPFDLASLYWPEQDMGIVVTGSLVGPITEEVVKRFAESMEPR